MKSSLPLLLLATTSTALAIPIKIKQQAPRGLVANLCAMPEHAAAPFCQQRAKSVPESRDANVGPNVSARGIVIVPPSIITTANTRNEHEVLQQAKRDPDTPQQYTTYPDIAPSCREDNLTRPWYCEALEQEAADETSPSTAEKARRDDDAGDDVESRVVKEWQLRARGELSDVPLPEAFGEGLEEVINL